MSDFAYPLHEECGVFGLQFFHQALPVSLYCIDAEK